MKNIKRGDIILMHDYNGRNSPTPEALKMMIPALLERGYEFVTVSELMNTNEG
jgi:peptidoglycan/xylan/chitin deacetylase (PgdA/CDA1 family)